MLKCELSCVLSGLMPLEYEANDVFEAIETATKKIEDMIKNQHFTVYTCDIVNAVNYKNTLLFKLVSEFGGTICANRYDYDIKANLRITKPENE